MNLPGWYGVGTGLESFVQAHGVDIMVALDVSGSVQTRALAADDLFGGTLEEIVLPWLAVLADARR